MDLLYLCIWTTSWIIQNTFICYWFLLKITRLLCLHQYKQYLALKIKKKKGGSIISWYATVESCIASIPDYQPVYVLIWYIKNKRVSIYLDCIVHHCINVLLQIYAFMNYFLNDFALISLIRLDFWGKSWICTIQEIDLTPAVHVY